ncbi:MAG: pseudouridine synthase [Pirellulales bacterium]|jgi:23S rRNA pseudouridine2605 synthase
MPPLKKTNHSTSTDQPKQAPVRPRPTSASKNSTPRSKSGGTRKLAAGGTEVRLQKVLAAAGLGSRRSCEELISEGRVEVDRQVVKKLGTKVNPDEQEIKVDGQHIARPTLRYYMLNKPAGVLCTNNDPAGRLRVLDLIGDTNHLFTIGRLDRSSEGLLIITNDGELANRIAHPSYEVSKVYLVRVAGDMRREDLAGIREGVYLSDGKAHVESIRIKSHQKKTTELEMVLSEGKNREIRRVLARVRHKVLMLKRIAIGPIRLADLPEGAYRELTYREVSALKKLTKSKSRSSSGVKKKRTARVRKDSASSSRSDASRNSQPRTQSKGNRQPTATGRGRPTASTGRGKSSKSSQSSKSSKSGAGRGRRR